jgi:AraC family transcriptional regulator
MALTSRLLACDTGWRVEDVVCTSGPHDRPFEERHDGVCIAAVTHGTFRYRSTLGSAVLAPGALLLGNDCHCFECSHDHGVGDRCLSFQFAPEFLETVIGAIPGAPHVVQCSAFAAQSGFAANPGRRRNRAR